MDDEISTGAGAPAPLGGFGFGCGGFGCGGFGGFGLGGLGGFGLSGLLACCAAAPAAADALRVGAAAADTGVASTPAAKVTVAPMSNHERFLITLTSACCWDVNHGNELAVGEGVDVVGG